MSALPRVGSTLVELLIVLTVLSLLAAVVSPAVAPPATRATQPDNAPRQLRAAAIRGLSAQRAAFGTATGVGLVRAEPTGLVLVDSAGQTREGRSVRVR